LTAYCFLHFESLVKSSMSETTKPSLRSITLGEIADKIGATIKGDSKTPISGISSIDDASPGQLTFLTGARHLPLLDQCKASAVIVPRELQEIDRNLLIVDQPYLALALAAQLFIEPPSLAPGIHPSAIIGEGVQTGADTRVGALAQIGSGSKIGDATRIYGGAYIGSNVTTGAGCLIYPGATILDGCVIGDRVIVQSGAIIGGDGFGYAQDQQGRHFKIPQMGIVQIDDDVEIGANTTIDRATFGRTWIQKGAKIDNLVMIAHNVVVGEHSILVAQVGVSGSTRLGKHVLLAGQVGIAGHLEIGDRVRIGAKSGVGHSVKAGEDISGIPAIPHREWLRTVGNLRRISNIRDEVRQLKQKIQMLEEALQKE
jgi:UDP-3-O-[3-hydroxymyristoyl] glucosamine N-acyltransferase